MGAEFRRKRVTQPLCWVFVPEICSPAWAVYRLHVSDLRVISKCFWSRMCVGMTISLAVCPGIWSRRYTYCGDWKGSVLWWSLIQGISSSFASLGFWDIPSIRNSPLFQTLCLPLKGDLGNPSHLWTKVPCMWLIPLSFHLLQNQKLNQECVRLSAVIFGGKGAEFEGKGCLFISSCSSGRNADLGTELAEEGQYCDLLSWFDRWFFRSGSESYSESFGSGCIWV